MATDIMAQPVANGDFKITIGAGDINDDNLASEILEEEVIVYNYAEFGGGEWPGFRYTSRCFFVYFRVSLHLTFCHPECQTGGLIR